MPHVKSPAGIATTAASGAPLVDGRRERSRQTRLAIVRAATGLFVAHGYSATTIAAIAAAADVAVQTVYSSFGTKRAILAEALDQAIAGDDADMAVNQREWMAPVWTADTAAERLAAYATAVRRIMAGAGDMFAVIAAAVNAEPDLVDLAATTEERRRTGAAAVVDAVRAVGPLRDGLDRDAAVDVLSLLNGPAVFHHLVRRSGWSLDRYERWLAGAFTREILAPDR